MQRGLMGRVLVPHLPYKTFHLHVRVGGGIIFLAFLPFHEGASGQRFLLLEDPLCRRISEQSEQIHS